MTIPLNQVSIFLSYAHQDEGWLTTLETHLSMLQRQGLISTWYDRQIVPGTNWSRTIDQRLEQASLIILLVSADFLASDYCYEVEMKRALELHVLGRARVIPLVVRPTDWKNAPFAHLNALPTAARAISSWGNQDEAFVDVVAGIRRAIEDQSFSPASPFRAALPDLWNIPYPRNPFFTGRDQVLARLHNQLHTGQATALSQSPHAISGLGGIGKTQIATEYAYLYRQDYEAVLWTRAESQDALISSYITLATLLKLPERNAENQEITIEAVKMWLQTHQKWLLILDNADNLDILPPFLPPVPGGHVLLTTRSWDMQRLAIRLEVETLSDEQGANLLLLRAGLLASETNLSPESVEDHRLATILTHELGGLPLALDQAGAYLEATGMSLQTYHSIYHTHRHTLLHERRSRIHDHPDPVATTWSLSFGWLREHNPAAADLLRLCAYLAPDAIAEEILTTGASVLGPVLEPIASDEFRLSQAIEALRAYSLIRRDPKERTLSIHRLVQAVLQDTLEENAQRTWAERAMLAINAAFPHPEHSTWSQCERLLIQALTGTQLIKQYQLITSAAGHLLFESASYLHDRARYSEAEPLFLQALDIQEHRLGSDHYDVATTLNRLANLYTEQGKYGEAKSLYQRALQIRELNLGPDHPQVAYPLNGLANLYKKQGKYNEAEPLYLRALQIRELNLGPDHPQVASPLNNLASLYYEQGQYNEAEPLFLRALHIWEHSLGHNHPDLAYPLNGLASLYYEQGQYNEAEPLFLRALHIREHSLGHNHPDVASPLNGLASLYSEQGQYTQAEPLFLRALHIREHGLGHDHPLVASTLNGLASLYSEQGQYTQAEPLLLRALHIRELSLGHDHPLTQEVQKNHAILLQTMKHDAETQKPENDL